MTDRKTKAIGFGVVLAVVGLFLIWGAVAPLTEDRDADGYFMSSPLTVDRESGAIVTDDVGLLRGRYETLVEEALILTFVAEPDDVRMQSVASGSDALFMGIAATSDVDAYLDGVAHDEITDWSADRADIRGVEYAAHEGTVRPKPPGTKTIWVASASGTGQQTLDWTIESGEWTVVVMNADASDGITADLSFGALPTSSLNAISWTAFVLGLVALIGGGSLLYLGFRRWSRNTTPVGDADNAVETQETETPREPVGPTS